MRGRAVSRKAALVRVIRGGTVRLYEYSILKSMRIQAGFSQQELADAVGVSRSTVSTLERGRSVPSVSLALALARHLGATVEELFALDDLR